MKKNIGRITMYIFICLFIIYYFISNILVSYKPEIIAHKGILDISQSSLEDTKIQKLDGEWEFYPNVFLEPKDFKNITPKDYAFLPSTWNNKNLINIDNGKGFGTFRLKIKTDSINSLMGIRVPAITSAYKLWVDGMLLGGQGILGTNVKEEEPKSYSITRYFMQQHKDIEIVLQVSNFSNRIGGFLEHLEFGTEEAIKIKSTKNNILEGFLIGVFFISALYNFSLYIVRKKDKQYFYFSIVNLLIALRTSLTGEKLMVRLYPNIDYEIFVKAEYISLCLLVVFFFKFLKKIYYKDFNKQVEKAVIITFSLYIPIIILFKSRVYSMLLPFYQWALLALVIYGFIALIKAMKNERNFVSLIFIGYMLFSLTVINDVLFYMGYIKTDSLASVGLFMFIAIHTIVLSLKYSKAFSTVEQVSEKLVLIDKLKDEFIENTSKQLKDPLGIVKDVIESLNYRTAHRREDAELINSLKIISSNTKDLFNIVNNLHDFAKIRNKEIVLFKKVVDIRQIIKLVCDLLKDKLQDKKIKVLNNISEDTSYILADESRLTKIFIDLIDFKIESMYNENLEIFCSNAGDFVAIHIINKKVSKEKKSFINILRPIRDNILRDVENEDIRLSIAKSLIDLHGGTISLNKNHTIIYMLKAKHKNSKIAVRNQMYGYLEKAMVENKTPLKTINPTGEFKILMADDDDINIQVLINQLSMDNYSLTIVDNGLQVIDIIEKSEEKFDLLILDSMMPKLSGFEVCKVLRKKFSIFDLPILLVMSKNNVEEISLAFEVGANDYILKPFSREELRARIKTLLTLKDAVQHAIINAHNLESEKYGRQLAEKLREITGALNSTLDLKEVIVTLLESLKNLVPYENACVMLKRESSLYIMAACNSSSCRVQCGEKMVSPNNKILKKIIEEKQFKVFSNIKGNREFGEKIEGCSCMSDGTSWMGIPLIAHNEVFGVLVLEHSQEGLYQEIEIDMAIAFAAQAAVAIENAKLFGEIKQLANTDPLSGLFNRRYFFELSEQLYSLSIVNNTPLSVIILDVDYFKTINDRYGHDVGDLILKEVSDIFASNIRKEDVVGRYGGEEFCMTLYNTTAEEARDIAERIRLAIENHEFIIEGVSISVTASFGVSGLKDYHTNYRQLLKESDKALYVSKKRGRNKVEVYNKVSNQVD